MQTNRKKRLCDKKGLEGIKQKRVMNESREKRKTRKESLVNWYTLSVTMKT